MRELFHYICCSLGYYCWLVVGCGSPEGLGIEGMFFYCALTGWRLSGRGPEGLGGWQSKIADLLPLKNSGH